MSKVIGDEDDRERSRVSPMFKTNSPPANRCCSVQRPFPAYKCFVDILSLDHVSRLSSCDRCPALADQHLPLHPAHEEKVEKKNHCWRIFKHCCRFSQSACAQHLLASARISSSLRRLRVPRHRLPVLHDRDEPLPKICVLKQQSEPSQNEYFSHNI